MHDIANLPSMATPQSKFTPAAAKPLDLEITIVSAKHLKNVNWKNGDLKPYVIFWLDPDRRLATKADNSGSTHPVWNERFTLPINRSLNFSFFTLEIFHSKPSETPKPLIGTLRVPLRDLKDSGDSNKIRDFELRRPSGRPQGKIRVKLSIRDRPLPDYHVAPPPNYFYSSAPPPQYPPQQDYKGHSSTYMPTPPPAAPAPILPSAPAQVLPPSQAAYVPPFPYVPQYQQNGLYANTAYLHNPCTPYQAGYYQPPPPPQPLGIYGGGPSAPIDQSKNNQKKGVKMGPKAGLAVGAVAGTLGGMTLGGASKYQAGKTVYSSDFDDDYSETDFDDDASDMHGNY